MWRVQGGREFAKNRGSFGHERQKSLVMVEEENEQEEDEAWNLVEEETRQRE